MDVKFIGYVELLAQKIDMWNTVKYVIDQTCEY